MSRRVAPLTLDSLDDLPSQCRRCVFWELDPVAGERAQRSGDAAFEKEAGLSRGALAFEKEACLSLALLEWGSVGRIAYVDDVPAGYVSYAPPHLVPRSVAF